MAGLNVPHNTSCRRFWHATHDCVAPYVDIVHIHRGRFWAKSAASGSVRWCFRSCWMVLSHVMLGWPGCLLQSAGGEANRILLASALSSMRIICPNVCMLQQTFPDNTNLPDRKNSMSRIFPEFYPILEFQFCFLSGIPALIDNTT